MSENLDLGGGALNLSSLKESASLLNLSGLKETSGGVLELCVVCGDRASGIMQLFLKVFLGQVINQTFWVVTLLLTSAIYHFDGTRWCKSRPDIAQKSTSLWHFQSWQVTFPSAPRSTLWRHQLRGLQGLLQEEHQEANRLVLTWMPPNPPSSPVLRVPVPGQQGLPRGQKS